MEPQSGFSFTASHNCSCLVHKKVQKKNFIENIIPIITSLKSLMEQKRIPALKDLMNYLRVRGSVFLLLVMF